MDGAAPVYTIGHSTLPVEQFIALLKNAGIQAIADVRSSPYSRRNPQFNRETLRQTLKQAGLAYSYLGDQLGGRPASRAFYCDGIADYGKMRRAEGFHAGLARLEAGMKTFRIALMCAERNPLECHRCLLVGRALHEGGKNVVHLLLDGKSLTQSDIEDELLRSADMQDADLFAPRNERIDAAYRAHIRRNAFSEGNTTAEDGKGGSRRLSHSQD